MATAATTKFDDLPEEVKILIDFSDKAKKSSEGRNHLVH
jgi:hypothetical protein